MARQRARNDYDHASRYTAKLDPRGFLRWLLGVASPLTFREWLDASATPPPGGSERTRDAVALLDNADDPEAPYALNVEFQTENDAEILERALEYVAGLRRELRRRGYRVVGVLVNLTGAPQNATLEMALPGEPGVGLRLTLKLRTLREEDAAALLDAIAAGTMSRCLLPWVPLMRGGGEAGIIERWKELAAAEPDPKFRADFGVLALTFSRLTSHVVEWTHALREWNMVESPVFKEFRAEGARSTQRENLIRILEVRFQGPVPSDLAATIETATDLDELRRWFDAALAAPTLAAFRETISR